MKDPAVKRIVFTGHSLGGAVAIVAYLFLRDWPLRPDLKVLRPTHRALSWAGGLTASSLLHSVLVWAVPDPGPD